MSTRRLTLDDLRKQMETLSNKKAAEASQRFFKTGPGQYGEGDSFMGIRVPALREWSRAARELSLKDLQILLDSKWHEQRLIALMILVLQFEKEFKRNPSGAQKYVDFYLKNLARINNWDLVDSSAPHILGKSLVRAKDRSILKKLATSNVLWERRIAVLSTFAFIREGDFHDCLTLCEMLMGDKADLMHKAMGWMLREVGKKDETVLRTFLENHATKMPRTTLRYAIERLEEKDRKNYLSLKKMRLGILKLDWGNKKKDYETDRLLNEIKKMKHHGEESIEPKSSWNACIPRVKVLELDVKQSKMLKALDKRTTLNSLPAIVKAKDKIKTHLALKKHKIPQPRTIVITKPQALAAAAKKVGGYPLILKDPLGSYGYGVMLLESSRSARSVVDRLMKPWGSMNQIIVQEYIVTGDKDTRLFVAKGKVIAAMTRKARKGEFRSNVELGAVCKAVRPTKKQIEIALKATEALGLDVAGVDLLDTKAGPVVIEVNANPGFKALEKATGVNVAGIIIEALVEKVSG